MERVDGAGALARHPADAATPDASGTEATRTPGPAATGDSSTNPQADDWEPRIVTILCNWCTYGAADLAGVNRLQYPTNFKVIRVPCTGRIGPKMILAAFRSGADGVWVSGCHPGDCHYISGNYYARRRFTMMRALLRHIGIDEDRLHFSWISAAEGPKFAATAREVIAAVKKAGPASQLIKTRAQVI